MAQSAAALKSALVEKLFMLWCRHRLLTNLKVIAQHHTCMNAYTCLLQPMLHPTKLGDSAGLLVGQKVFAIGNPFGLDHTLTSGIISGTGREISSGNTGRPIQVSHPQLLCLSSFLALALAACTESD